MAETSRESTFPNQGPRAAGGVRERFNLLYHDSLNLRRTYQGSGLNGTGISLSRCGVTISVWVAWRLHQLVLLWPELKFSFFFASRTLANFQFRDCFKKTLPLRLPAS